MNVFIAKIDYFDPDSWRVLAAPYGGQNPESSRKNIADVAHKLGDDGIVDPVFRRKWLIRLSEKQAKVALGVLEKHADGPFDLPRPDRGFICDL
ncbi:MAG: hypothetical protein ACPG67_04485 [Candidatus Puniceispirillaceae bacterium]